MSRFAALILAFMVASSPSTLMSMTSVTAKQDINEALDRFNHLSSALQRRQLGSLLALRRQVSRLPETAWHSTDLYSPYWSLDAAILKIKLDQDDIRGAIFVLNDMLGRTYEDRHGADGTYRSIVTQFLAGRTRTAFLLLSRGLKNHALTVDDSRDAEVEAELGINFAAKGEKNIAREHLLASLLINPNFQLALLSLGMLDQSKNNAKNARQRYLQIINTPIGAEGVADTEEAGAAVRLLSSVLK